MLLPLTEASALFFSVKLKAPSKMRVGMQAQPKMREVDIGKGRELINLESGPLSGKAGYHGDLTGAHQTTYLSGFFAV